MYGQTMYGEISNIGTAKQRDNICQWARCRKEGPFHTCQLIRGGQCSGYRSSNKTGPSTATLLRQAAGRRLETLCKIIDVAVRIEDLEARELQTAKRRLDSWRVGNFYV